MKKQILILTSLGLLSTSLLCREQIEIFKTLTSAHTALFSKDNLILKPIKPEEKNDWYFVLNEVQKYVAANAPRFLTECKSLLQINSILCNTLEQNYRENLMGYVRPNKNAILTLFNRNLTKPRAEAKRIREFFEKYRDPKTGLFLDTPTGFSKYLHKKLTPNEKDACQLLYALALSLETTFNHVFREANSL